MDEERYRTLFNKVIPYLMTLSDNGEDRIRIDANDARIDVAFGHLIGALCTVNPLLISNDLNLYDKDGNEYSNAALAIPFLDSYLANVGNKDRINVSFYYENAKETYLKEPTFIREYEILFNAGLDINMKVILVPYNNGTIIEVDLEILPLNEACNASESSKYPYFCLYPNKTVELVFRYFSKNEIGEDN